MQKEVNDYFVTNQIGEATALQIKRELFDGIIRVIPIRWKTDIPFRTIYTTSTNIDPLAISMAFSKKAYLIHQSALGVEATSTINVAIERSLSTRKTSSYQISQEDIDKAFTKLPRDTTKVAYYRSYKFVIRERAFSAMAGVYTKKIKSKINSRLFEIRLTNLARTLTLIDMAINPHQSGGIEKVIKEYAAIDSTTIEEMYEIYTTLNLIYPYWQRVGYFIQASSKNFGEQWMRKFGQLQLNFYANRPFENSWKFNEEWRIFSPYE